MTRVLSEDLTKRTWEAIAQVFAAHLTMLRDVSILDDEALSVLLGAVDGVRDSSPTSRSLAPLLHEFEQRIDAIVPPEMRGAHHIGRGTADALATVSRLVIRADLISLATSANELRATILDVAGTQVVSLVAAYAGGQPAQPTTIAHLFGGVIGPLQRASGRLPSAFEAVNQSPMGAATLASTGFEIDPQRTATLLGFAGPIANAYDAVSAVDHIVDALHAAGLMVAPVSRVLDELLQWIRNQPDAVQFEDAWRASDPVLPQLESPEGLTGLAKVARDVERRVASLRGAITTVPYGPVLGPHADALLSASDVIASASDVLDSALELFASGMQFNRAVLANRAGKGMITSSDLADFLIVEEQLPPAAAQAIAGRAIALAREEGREASGITPELIDSAALFVIGRELRVEFETISRYLAPRRFIERRALPGGPAPAAMRHYLEDARNRLDEDRRWQDDAAERLAEAARLLERELPGQPSTEGPRRSSASQEGGGATAFDAPLPFRREKRWK